MYYICKKRENDLGIRYGIMDTKDGIVEYYSPREVISFVREHGKKIDGVSQSSETGKWTIKVLKPSAYVVDDEAIYSDTASNGVTYKLANGSLVIDYPVEWGKLDTLDEAKLDIIFEPYRVYLDKVLADAEIAVDKSAVDYIDGTDCVGYDMLKVEGTSYHLSIFTNPSYASKFYQNATDGQVVIGGIGADLAGTGKDIDDCHFDSGISNDLGLKLRNWLTELLNTIKADKEVALYNGLFADKMQATVDCIRANFKFRDKEIITSVDDIFLVSPDEVGNQYYMRKCDIQSRAKYKLDKISKNLYIKDDASIQLSMTKVDDSFLYCLYVENGSAEDFGIKADSNLLFRGTDIGIVAYFCELGKNLLEG